jgi:hypothetical protein
MILHNGQIVRGNRSTGSPNVAALIVFVLLVCASLSPVLLTPIPAMVDYPNHLARMYILVRSGGPDANPYYDVVWAFYPNLGMDLIIPQLARLFSVETASRLFLLLSQGLVITGALALERVAKGRIQAAGFAAVMFLYCLPFAWGFVNFEFGLGGALWGVAIMLLILERSWPVRLSVNTVFVAALFAAHFFALGVYGATLGICELWRAWERKAPHNETALRLMLLAIPALALLGAMQLTAGAIGFEGTNWFVTFKLLWPFRIINGYSLTASATSMAALLGALYIAGKRGYMQLETCGLWIAIGFAILYIAIPSRLFGTAFTDLRILVAAALILPAFCTLSMPHPLTLAALAGAAGITVTNLAVVLTVWLSYRADYAAMIESFRKLDRGALVLIGGSGAGEDPPFRDLTEYPIYYAPTLAVAYANAFVPNLFTAVGKQPVQARPNVKRLDITHGGPVPVTVLMAIAAGNKAPEIPPFIRSWTRDYDYLYLLGQRIANPMPELLEELVTSRRFVLYKIRRAR